MAMRIKVLVGFVLLLACSGSALAARYPSRHWPLFAAYLAAVLLSSGMKVSLPKSDSTMSVNFPFILLAIIQLSLAQALALAAISVFAQCNFRVQKLFTAVQIAFNVANVINATVIAWLTYSAMLSIHLSVAPALSVAVVAYFLSNTVPLALVISGTRGERVWPLWANNFLWYLPFYFVGAAFSALAHLLGLRYGWPTSLLLVPGAYTITRSYNAQVARIRDREQHIAEMEALHLRTIEGLAMAIEAKDQNTHDHLLRVRVYVAEIGEALNISKAEMQAVLTAALLHDIGKLAVPEHIINKPGRLSHDEFEKMKIHPVVGAEILERVRFPYPVVPIVRSHHEWWNGMGYPDGLAGEAIPIGARILTVVDCFDALASDRPYRRAMPIAEAMGIVKKLSGTQFDPRVVDALEQRYVALEAQARLEGEKLLRLNTEIAVERGAQPGAGFEQDAQASTTATSLPQPGGIELLRTSPVPDEESRLLELAALRAMDDLLAMAQSSSYALTAAETAAAVAARLRPLLAFDCHMVYLRQGESAQPQLGDGSAARYFSAAAFALGEGISGWVIHNGMPIMNGNPAVEPNSIPLAGADPQPRSALSVPLVGRDGSTFAALTLYSLADNAFSREHLQLLHRFESKISLTLEHALAEKPVAPQARLRSRPPASEADASRMGIACQAI